MARPLRLYEYEEVGALPISGVGAPLRPRTGTGALELPHLRLTLLGDGLELRRRAGHGACDGALFGASAGSRSVSLEENQTSGRLDQSC